MKNNRPTKEEYYLNIACEVSKRATCMSSQWGCIIVKDDQIISTGYNGAPRKTKDCFERGECLRRQLHIPSGTHYELCRSVHAEQNAIINAARAGVSLLGGDVYMTGRKVHNGENRVIASYPCFICKKMIINAGIRRVICSDDKGKTVVYLVDEWATDWAKQDMLDDMQKYDAQYKLTKVP